MNRGLLASLASLCLAALGPTSTALAAEAGSKILSPYNGAVVHAPDILLVFTVAATTKVQLQMDGKRLDIRDVPVPGNDEDLHHFRISLEDGRHSVRWVDAATEAELGALTVTYVPPYSLRTVKSAGDTPYLFHTQEREGKCSGCHNLPEVFETIPDKPLAPAGKVCGACHPSIEAKPNLHGPVAVYACFMCHNSHYSPTRFSQKTSQGAACGSCHQNFLDRILGGKKFVHGPVAAGVCLVCHDPHGGKTKAIIRETSPKLCLLCHAETLPLPVEKALHGKVACTQCHDPHGGQTAALTTQDGNSFCATCHPDVAKATGGHPVPKHPVSAPIDPSKPGRAMGCTSCHAAHSLKDVSQAGLPKDEAARKQFCRKCHY